MTPLQAAFSLLERAREQGKVRVHERPVPATRGKKRGGTGKFYGKKKANWSLR